MATIRVARNATGFHLAQVAALLSTCEFIFTTNRYMMPVIEQLFPKARILVMAQDMNHDMIRELLLVSNFITKEDEVEVVSALKLYDEIIAKLGGGLEYTQGEKVSAEAYHKAVRGEVESCRLDRKSVV